ncbi:MAG: LysM peptidoglycan-binding domain-containing protein [Marinobacter sp.]|nr:LysM peptidoglycan-binding domain-containing protein [Marinobacter sp.]
MSQLVNTPDYSQHYDTLLYRVKPGDTLHGILKRYHRGISEQALIPLVQQVQADNPKITNPDFILPDQLISLTIPQQYCSAPTPYHRLETIRTEDTQWAEELEQTWSHSTREERDLMSILLPAAIGLGSASMSTIDTTFKNNAPLLREMTVNYERYKAGQITKGQYSYRRQRMVNQLTASLGPTSLLLNGRKPPSEVLRISRKKGSTPTANIEAQINKVKTTMRAARGGGILLTGVSLGVACHQIASASAQHEKNEIFVEVAGGVVAGVIFSLGASITLLAMATPVGWVGGLVIGIGGAVAGYIGGKAGVTLYDITGKKVDFVSSFNIDAACSATRSARNTSILSNSALSML